MSRVSTVLLAACLIAAPAVLHAEVNVSLNGSRASMLRQNRIAKEQQYSFLRHSNQVLRFVDDGYLIELPGNADYRVLAGYPYARPSVRSFVERLADGYRSACGEQLVVTSLTRPTSAQPRNASPLSVHPAGMAVDMRVSTTGSCRDWLSAELLALEAKGVIDGTREYRPPHFHVAVFPEAYIAYDDALRVEEAAAAAQAELDARAANESRVVQAVADLLSAARSPAPVRELPFVFHIALLLARTVLPV